MGLLELCEKYFNTTNLYEVLGISEKATEKEVKKAYHKLSLQVHPDRVNDDEKLEATEKFKVLGGVHAILSDKDKRAVYDETKSVDDGDEDFGARDWTVYWRMMFKKITDDDIRAYEKEYIGSSEERRDIKKAYMAGKGDMDYITDHVQFARTEHEPRLRDTINEMIKAGELPAYKIFTHEPNKKRQRRIAKENRESKEAEEWKKEIGLETDTSGGENSLVVMLGQRQQDREKQMETFFDNLEAKYGGKPKATKAKAKRKAAVATEATRKSKRRKM